jgi:HEAT repeat protein
MHLRASLPVLFALAATASAQPAHAGDLRTHARAGGGLDAIEVWVDAPAGVVRTRRAGSEKQIPIAIEKSRIDTKSASVTTVPIGEGRRVVRVRVPDLERQDLAFEALLSGASDVPIFAGLTGYTRGSEGDRAGSVVLVYDRDAESKFVIVAETREDTRICGQAITPLAPRGLDAKSMQLRGATLHRLEKKARDDAQRVIATAHEGRAPLSQDLVATGGSAEGAAALTDGDPATTWHESRPGDGHGEFATMRAAEELPIHALVVTVAPPAPSPDGAAPRTFFVATDHELFHVTMPEDAWQKPGARYAVPLPKPVRTTCVAVVLDEAYAGGRAAPVVSLAEVSAWTSFDAEGATLNDVARALGTKRAEPAAALLRRAGEPALAAAAEAYPSLDARGRALAVDVASAGGCDGAAVDLLTLALTDQEREVRRRALGRIERCGKAASASLARVVKGPDEARRAAAAPLLALVAPSAALEPLASQLGEGSVETRRAVRGALARVSASAPRERLLALVTQREAPARARLELLRALGARLPDLRPEADAVLADLLRGSPDMPTRYLLAQPLAHLARSKDATEGELTRLAALALRDPDWPVRARAVELSAGVLPLAPTVVAAASDPEPRVREAALRAIASSSLAAGARPASELLAGDPWTFVRVAAADALATAPDGPPTTSALVRALRDDASPLVRAAAIVALGRQRATSQTPAIRERLDDAREDVEVRALAARTLGVMCASGAADRLTKLAHLARSPVDETDDRMGIAAIEALGTLHPPDLAARLAPLRGKDVRLPVRRAAERAMAEPGSCR